MKDVVFDSVYFGIALSLVCYWIAVIIHRKWPITILNPLLISTVMIIAVLLLFQIDYKAYDEGAKYLTYFIQPATICLAVPLYRQLRALKDNIATVIISVTAGCLSNALFITVLGLLWKLDPVLIR
ncbi:MAG: LrgB family protein, partial [Clostridia bacterium]|nr:LrgB family protein [Clostridia bacterium]